MANDKKPGMFPNPRLLAVIIVVLVFYFILAYLRCGV